MDSKSGLSPKFRKGSPEGNRRLYQKGLVEQIDFKFGERLMH